jgi:hypothetical protein
LNEGQITRTPLNQDNIYDEKVSESWHVKKFAMPDIKEGSVIEYKYKVISPYIFNLRDWEFQNKIPTIYSEYILRQIPFYEYTWLLQGTTKFDIQKSYIDEASQKEFASVKYKEMVHHFGMKNVSAFRDESFISSINDFILKIDFQLVQINHPNGVSVPIMETWEEINKDLLLDNSFGKYLNACESNAKNILKNYPQISTYNDREKFDFIVNYVKSNYNWNELQSRYSSKNIKEFLKEKSGNSADMNLFVTGMLIAAGLEAYPVIISTREHGKVYYEYPFLHFFNYVIVLTKLNECDILTDATEVACPNDKIPPRCINGKGLIVKKNTIDWIGLTAIDTSAIFENISMTFNQKLDSITGDFNIQYYSYDAMEFRKKFYDETDKIIDYWSDRGLSNIDSISSENLTDFSKPYNIVFRASFPASRIENRILVQPFFNEPVTENPFKQIIRQYPIDMIYPVKREYTSYINIPEGMDFLELPEDFRVTNDNVIIRYEIRKQDTTQIVVKASFHFKKSLYLPKDYNNIKLYYKEIISRFNQPLILVRRTSLSL